MIPLHSILATQNMAQYLGLFGACLYAVILLIAFSMGFVKGFRRVRWGGLIWFSVSILFIVFGYIPALREMVSGWGTIGVVGVALVCVLAMLALYGVLAHFLRPRMRWVKDVRSDTSLAEYGLEFEPEYLDYDGENDYAPYGKILHKTGYGTPSFFGRLMGGLTCMINSTMVFLSLVSFALVIVGTTKLSEGYLGSVLTAPFIKMFFQDSMHYAMDVLALGLIIIMARKGYDKGFLSSLRSLIVVGGGVVAVVFCMYIPFTIYAFATDGFFYFVAQLVSRAEQAFYYYGVMGLIIARILAGIILSIFAIIAFVLINIFLKKCCHMVEKTGPTRVIDGCLAAVLYAVIGVLLCFAIWVLFGMLDYFDVLKFREALTERAILSRGMLDFVRNFFDSFLAPTMG